MSSMALYRNHRDFDLRRVHVGEPHSAPARPHRGLFRRILAALDRSRRLRAEEEAGRFIAAHGGRLTDDVERQLAEHFNGGGFPPVGAERPFRPFADL
jgi:hypothetical protein